jgi:hypothetical protein
MVTDRFFSNLVADQIWFRLIRFGSGSDRINQGATNRGKKLTESHIQVQEQHKLLFQQ